MGRKLQAKSEIVNQEPEVEEVDTPSDDDGLSNLEDELNEAEQSQDNEVKEPESVEESVRAAIKDIKEGQESGDKPENEEQSSEPVKAGDPNKKETKGEEKLDEDAEEDDYDPPVSLDKKGKALFSKLPKEFKPQVSKFFKDQEAHFTRTQQELKSYSREARGIVEAVRPYYTSTPELARQGITESGFVAALVGTYQRLKDPKTTVEELQSIGKSRGLTVQVFDSEGSLIEGETQAITDISEHPEIKSLREQNNLVTAWIKQQTLDAQATPIRTRLEAMREEVDRSGNLLYPEMQSAEFIQYAKPLVSAKVGNDPRLSYPEALREVIQETRKSFGYSGLPNQTKLPVANTTNNRSASSAITVRGRVTPPVSNQRVGSQPQKGETMEESVRAAIEDLKRGIIN